MKWSRYVSLALVSLSVCGFAQVGGLDWQFERVVNWGKWTIVGVGESTAGKAVRQPRIEIACVNDKVTAGGLFLGEEISIRKPGKAREADVTLYLDGKKLPTERWSFGTPVSLEDLTIPNPERFLGLRHLDVTLLSAVGHKTFVVSFESKGGATCDSTKWPPPRN